MPILKNAKKALRVSKRKTVINSRIKSRMKTLVDAFKKAPTMESLSAAYSAVDTAVKKNIIQKNKAARLKSQLSAVLPKGEAGTKVTKKAVSVAKKAKKTTKTAKKAVKKTAKKAAKK